MTNTVLLDNITHQDLRVVTKHSADFGDNINQALIFPTEFTDIHREYPIFFNKDAQGVFQSIALLGLDRDENLFLDENGWQARYVPAIQKRGPFFIGFQEKMIDGEPHQEPMIHVDLDHDRISDSDGELLFKPHGGNTPYLEHIGTVLRTIHQGIDISTGMFAAFEEMGLIEKVDVEIKLSDTEQYNVPDYYSISEENLMQLDGTSLERLNKAGFLRLAFLVLASLGNVSRIVDMKNQKRAID
ncbi:MAG: peptide ABC transporter permease [Robiginitomaculum sp.]|nr:MAG: peptide ABC transporter permease [Robiginitomaculum sp.]